MPRSGAARDEPSHVIRRSIKPGVTGIAGSRASVGPATMTVPLAGTPSPKSCSASSERDSRFTQMSEPPTCPSLRTAEELLYVTQPDTQTELVRGTLIVREPPGYQHGVVALKVAR